jgi:hypothetical protein
MIDINIANFITVGLMSVLAYALVQFLLNKMGWSVSWL